MPLRRTLMFEVLACSLVAVVVAGAAAPLRGASDDSPGVKCIANVKQMSHAMAMYAADADDYLPPKTGWMDTTGPYVKDSSSFHCPSVTSDQYGYAYNFLCAGNKISNLPRPTKTSLIFESTNMRRSAFSTAVTLPRPGRHDGKNTVSYVDGHVAAEVPVR